MKIVLDGMGGDHAPAEIVKGAVMAAGMIKHDIYRGKKRCDRSRTPEEQVQR